MGLGMGVRVWEEVGLNILNILTYGIIIITNTQYNM